jgi:hypothetical protein
MVFTNLPGPKTPLIFNGYECKKLMFFVPALGSIGTGISVVSYADIIKVGCISDESMIKDPSHLISIFNENFKRILD